jgi:outer membrane murein-binding lipoprotein Lpp
MKISKASWMILGIGVFIIVLAGLGIARSGQVKEQDNINQELSLSNARLGNMQVTQLQTQINELQEQLNEAQDQSDEAKDRLKQKIISVDITDKFYEIAHYYGVTVDDIGTTSVAQQPYASLNCDTISLNANITGGPDDVVKFVTGLNDNFTTGFVRSIQLTNSDNETSSINVQMVVYSYKGS